MKRVQAALNNSNITLNKVASKQRISGNGLSDWPAGQKPQWPESWRPCVTSTAKLGLQWDMNIDSFFFDVTTVSEAYTRRGVLSVVNSLFDPMGFLPPITIKGKLILRNLVSGSIDWDEPLQSDRLSEWIAWNDSLSELKQVYIPRSYSKASLRGAWKVELRVFCDASELAIAAVAYLVIYTEDGTHHTSFVLGKAKVAPTSGHTIPRLELCAAVLAVQIAQIVTDNIDTVKLHDVK